MCCSKRSALVLLVVMFSLLGLSVAQSATESMPVTTPMMTLGTGDGGDVAVTARTFGHHFLKRISFAMIPAAFVVGVITTLLAALTVVSMKGLGIGVILLIITVGQMLGRILPAATPAGLSAVQYQAPVQAPYPLYVKENWRR